MANIGWLRPGDVTNDTDSEGDEEMETQEMSKYCDCKSDITSFIL